MKSFVWYQVLPARSVRPQLHGACCGAHLYDVLHHAGHDERIAGVDRPFRVFAGALRTRIDDDIAFDVFGHAK
jgi:hypothetical protein